VQALRNGHWVLLDEINLASPETLQRISSLLDNGARGTIVLTENGEIRPVVRHPNFRLFAAMNPATDVGKRDLPPALRSRFSELYVDEVTDASDLAIVIEKYMRGVERPPIDAIVQCYIAARTLSEISLFDGAGRSPKYSLRTLCRALEASRIFYDRRYRLELSLAFHVVSHAAGASVCQKIAPASREQFLQQNQEKRFEKGAGKTRREKARRPQRGLGSVPAGVVAAGALGLCGRRRAES
jgi:MoxR-like ATPase